MFLSQAKGVEVSGNITLVVVYEPATRSDDYYFQIMRLLYESLMSDLGIPIEFIANL